MFVSARVKHENKPPLPGRINISIVLINNEINFGRSLPKNNYDTIEDGNTQRE